MKKGFTLIELLVVISIIGILTTLLVVNFVGARERARDSQKIRNLNEIKNALRIYYNDKQAYPICSGACLNTAEIGGTYISGISQIGYTYNGTDGNSFILRVGLESGAGSDDISSQLNCGIGTTVDKVYAVCSN